MDREPISENEQSGTSSETSDPHEFAIELGRQMVEAGCEFIDGNATHPVPMIIAISVYGTAGEEGYKIRYEFCGGGSNELERLHSVVRLLRECHQVAIEQLRIMELAAIPSPSDITGFN